MSNLKSKLSAFFSDKVVPRAPPSSPLPRAPSPVQSPNIEEYVVIPSLTDKSSSSVAKCDESVPVDINIAIQAARNEASAKLAYWVRAMLARKRARDLQPKLYNVDPSLDSEVRTALFEQQHGFHLSDREKVEVFRASHGLPITSKIVDEIVAQQHGFPTPSPAADASRSTVVNLNEMHNVDPDMKDEVRQAIFRKKHGFKLSERERLILSLYIHGQRVSAEKVNYEMAHSHGFSEAKKPALVVDSDISSSDSHSEGENTVRLRFSPRPKPQSLAVHQHNFVKIRFSPTAAATSSLGKKPTAKKSREDHPLHSRWIVTPADIGSNVTDASPSLGKQVLATKAARCITADRLM